jgi:hypothetical protein
LRAPAALRLQRALLLAPELALQLADALLVRSALPRAGQRGQSAALDLLAPLGKVGLVKSFSAQQRPELAVLKPRCLLDDAQLLLRAPVLRPATTANQTG